MKNGEERVDMPPVVAQRGCKKDGARLADGVQIWWDGQLGSRILERAFVRIASKVLGFAVEVVRLHARRRQSADLFKDLLTAANADDGRGVDMRIRVARKRSGGEGYRTRKLRGSSIVVIGLVERAEESARLAALLEDGEVGAASCLSGAGAA
jgi:hypothetical protein